MCEVLRGDEVVDHIPLAYFKVSGIPAQSWMFDDDLGLETVETKSTYFTAKKVPSEALDQPEVIEIWAEVNADLYEVEIEQWFYSMETCTFDLEGFGKVGR